MSVLVQPPLADMKNMMNTRGGPKPRCLHAFADADLKLQSRYAGFLLLNGACVWDRSRLQPSIAIDITDSESYAYSVVAVIMEVAAGLIEDMGYASCVELPLVIGADNDATLRIAADAASAKRAIHILRRMWHTRWLTDNDKIAGIKLDRDLNLADLGTHYSARDVIAYFEPQLMGSGA